MISNYSYAESAARAKKMVGTKGYGGRCLEFSRTMLGIGAKDGAAYTAWKNAAKRHTDRSPKIGAPAFFAPNLKYSPYGHVAIYIGGGKIVSTMSTTNRIGIYTIRQWEAWGYKYLGWAEDLNGALISPIAHKGTRKVVSKTLWGRTSYEVVKTNHFKQRKQGYPLKYVDLVHENGRFWVKTTVGHKYQAKGLY